MEFIRKAPGGANQVELFSYAVRVYLKVFSPM